MDSVFFFSRIGIREAQKEIRREIGEIRNLEDLLRSAAWSTHSILLQQSLQELADRSARLREELGRTAYVLIEYEEGTESDLRRIGDNYEKAEKLAEDIFL